MKNKTLVTLVICLILITNSVAQSSKEIYSSKVATLDTILASLYDVVSGEKTKKRNWDLLKYLCHKDAKFIIYGASESGGNEITYMTIDAYDERAGDYFTKNDFFEREIHRTVDTFGPITQVFSTYASFDSAMDKVPFARGINSIQLLNDGARWWIVNIYWTSESETNPIPEKYLPKDQIKTKDNN